jgi:DtxR family transcriptional regulator, Mn-dependent transcriptional regulator
MTIWVAALIAIAAAGFALWSFLRDSDTRRRTLIEDALKHLFDQQYRGRHGSFASLGGQLRLSDRRMMQLLAQMQHQGLVVARGQEFELTAEGERVARQIVRAHRLLERYFADEARLPLKQVHAAAERREHSLTSDQIDALSASLGHPRMDPHGDPIPGRDGQIVPAGDTPITAWPADKFGRITHLEDEPPLAYAQILAEGLRVGQIVRILESTPERIVLTDGDHEFRLAPAVAANVFLAPAAAPAASDIVTLADLKHGEHAEIVGLDVNCQGFSRRRLMDMGFTPGARLEPVLDTFAGDPRAYRVRDTLVALRADQASQVLVRPVAANEASGTGTDARIEAAR